MGKPIKISGQSRPFGLLTVTLIIGLAVVIARIAGGGVLLFAIAGGVGAGVSSWLMGPRWFEVDGDRARIFDGGRTRILTGSRRRLIAEGSIDDIKLRETPGQLQGALRGHEIAIDGESVFVTNGPWRRLKAAVHAAHTTT